MTACSALQAIIIALFILNILVIAAHPQPSTAPPSSLPTTPLSSGRGDPSSPGSCDLCRPLEGRPGSDLRHQRHRQDKSLHPQKKPKGGTKSDKRSLMNQLPHRKLERERQQPEE
jgi:hypothetical protein